MIVLISGILGLVAGFCVGKICFLSVHPDEKKEKKWIQAIWRGK